MKFNKSEYIQIFLGGKIFDFLFWNLNHQAQILLNKPTLLTHLYQMEPLLQWGGWGAFRQGGCAPSTPRLATASPSFPICPFCPLCPEQVRDGKFPDAKVLVNKPSDLPVALQGYDPVSYFTRNKAIEGSKRFGAVHEDAVYLFSTPDNRDMFAKAPHKYVPAFGGFCGLAVTHNKLKDVKPDCFDVVKDRLVLLSGKEALSMWLKDRQGLLAEADANWPRLVVTNGGMPLIHFCLSGIKPPWR